MVYRFIMNAADVVIESEEGSAVYFEKMLERPDMTSHERKYYLGKLYDAMLKMDSWKRSDRFELAGKYRVSDVSLDRFREYAKGIDAIEDMIPGIRQHLLKGYDELTAKLVTEMVDIRPEVRKQIRDMFSAQRVTVVPDKKEVGYENEMMEAIAMEIDL